MYACYVSKVFQDDEDSCECFCLLLKACWSSSSTLFSRLDLLMSYRREGFCVSDPGLWMWVLIVFSCLSHAEQYHCRGFPLGDLSAPSVGSIKEVCRNIPTVGVSVCLLASACLPAWVCHLCFWMVLLLTYLLWVFHSQLAEEIRSRSYNMTSNDWVPLQGSVTWYLWSPNRCYVIIIYMSQHSGDEIMVTSNIDVFDALIKYPNWYWSFQATALLLYYIW